MKNKKSLLILLIVLAFGFVQFGCKNYLNKQPIGRFTSKDAFTSSQDAVIAVDGAYSPLNFHVYNWDWSGGGALNRLVVVGDIGSDDALKGSTGGDQPDMGRIDNLNYTADNNNFLGYWRRNYEGINRCNMVLANVPSIKMDSNLKERILGEAKFLRALYYFYLVKGFGGVPLVLHPIHNVDSLQIARATKKQTYDQIIKDATDAANVLPVKYSNSDDVGRATKGAALALIAKAYLFQQEWQKSLDYINKVQSLGRYSLLSKYADLFDGKHKNNVESIFEIQQVSGASPSEGNILNAFEAMRPVGGWGFVLPTKNFVDAFKPGDPRLGVTVAKQGSPYAGTTFDSTWSQTGYATKKYVQPRSETPNGRGDGGRDIYVIRYADVLLWKAECLAELNQTTAALQPLNKVRERVNMPDITETNQQKLIAIIHHERRVELGFEMHRMFDLIRWHDAKSVFANLGMTFPDRDYLFPIPQRELDTDHSLKQNPGY